MGFEKMLSWANIVLIAALIICIVLVALIACGVIVFAKDCIQSLEDQPKSCNDNKKLRSLRDIRTQPSNRVWGKVLKRE